MSHPSAARRDLPPATTERANRAWWDAEAEAYHAEHGAFLGDAGFVWGPEGWTEEQLGLLPLGGEETVLEIGAGAAQCSRWLAARHPRLRVVATDLSAGMVQVGRRLNRDPGPEVPLAQCDALALPFGDAAFDVVFTAYGVVPFVADSARLLRECARVLRPGGTLVFATSHPVRWAFPDVPGEEGLRAAYSYFDRTPYVESDGPLVTYAEHHRTMGDRVREIVAAGLTLVDLVEPEWPPDNESVWGGWSPLRGAVLPGTAIFCCVLDSCAEPPRQ